MSISFKRNIRQFNLLLFSFIYLLAEITHYSLFITLSAILLIIVVIQTVPYIGKFNRTISLALFLLGGVFLLNTTSSMNDWITAFSANAGLVVLFIALPFLNFPFYYDEYESALRDFYAKNIKGLFQFSNFSTLMTYSLSSLVNIGSFPIVYNVVRKSTDLKNKEKTLCQCMMRANTAALFWSPNFVAVAVILHYLNIPWIKIVPMGLILSLLVIISIWISVLAKIKVYRIEYQEDNIDQCSHGQGKNRLRSLGLIFIQLILLVVFFNIFTDLNILTIVPLIAFIYPFLLAIMRQKLAVYKNKFKNYYNVKLLNINNEIIIFAAAGFFGKSLEISGVGKIIPSLLHLENINSPFLATLIILALVIFTGIIGIHPVVTCSVIASTILPETLGITLYSYAFTLLAAYGLSVLVSPFSGTTLVTAGLFKRTSWDVGVRLNIVYTLSMALVFAIVLPFIP